MNNTKGFSAFDNGFGFANAFCLLYSKSSVSNLKATKSYIENYSNMSLIMPTLVNGAFACELFLKALVQQECKTHSLVDLLTQLEVEHPEKAVQIKEKCIRKMRENKGRSSYDEQKYCRDLETFDMAFNRLRYWHEPMKEPKTENERQYDLDFLGVLVVVLLHECLAVYGPRPLISPDNAP